MKKTIFALTAILLFAACNSNEKTARSKVEEYIQANANDPDSYEFIKMEEPDTVRISDTLRMSIFIDSLSLSTDKSFLEFSKSSVADYEDEIKGQYGYIYMESYKGYVKEVEEYTEKVEKAEKKIEGKKKKIQSLDKNPESDKIVSVIYTVNFRLKNGLGALMKTRATIVYSPGDEKWGKVNISKI
jgi:hypothetical protein